MVTRLFGWFALVYLVLACSSCGFHSKNHMVQYLGKSEDEIVQILGSPTGWCGGPAEGEDPATAAPRRIMYRMETASLPEPITGLDFVMSSDGFCREVAGFTRGFASPEDLLETIGLPGKDLVRTEEDDTGIRYEASEAKTVLVYKPNRVPDRYSDFLVTG